MSKYWSKVCTNKDCKRIYVQFQVEDSKKEASKFESIVKRLVKEEPGFEDTDEYKCWQMSRCSACGHQLKWDYEKGIFPEDE